MLNDRNIPRRPENAEATRRGTIPIYLIIQEDMAENTLRYPIGIQTFRDIVEGGYVYVDKTGYVADLADKYRYVFLSRPRRFGKSLLSSTFHSYFAGEKDLFHGLKAGEVNSDWRRHPVFHFDMSTAKHMTEEQLVRNLGYKLTFYEEEYGNDTQIAREDVNARLERLVIEAVRKTGEKAVIIIDEYDAPLLDVMNDKDRLVPTRQIMRNFYSPIKSLDPYLGFVFITGINKFAQLSIFSELNNLQNISMMPEYSAVCGVSQRELESKMQDSVLQFAQRLSLTKEQTLVRLKENYDGYHFSHNSEEIYNPFSLIKALNAGEFGSYWFESGTPTYLIERLEKHPIDERELDRMTEVSKSDFDVSPEISDNSLPMLYQTGYLTIKGYSPEDDSYTLGYPNKEVKIGFIKDLLARYRSADGMSSSFVLKFNKALKEKNIDSALDLMKSFLAGIPNDLENKTEKHYQTIIYLIFSLLGYYIQSEVKSAIGRADAVCRTKDRIYVFEFKVDGSAEEALRQIDTKGYLIPYKAEEGMELVKVGVNISTQTRTIDAWKEVVG